ADRRDVEATDLTATVARSAAVVSYEQPERATRSTADLGERRGYHHVVERRRNRRTDGHEAAVRTRGELPATRHATDGANRVGGPAGLAAVEALLEDGLELTGLRRQHGGRVVGGQPTVVTLSGWRRRRWARQLQHFLAVTLGQPPLLGV